MSPKVDEHGRLLTCVEAWPGCAEGEYNPACCRFPKSCSCTVVYPEQGKVEVVDQSKQWPPATETKDAR